MKTKNVILLSLLLSTVTVFAVEPQTEKKTPKPTAHPKDVQHESAYDREEEKGKGTHKKSNVVKEESAMEKHHSKKEGTTKEL